MDWFVYIVESLHPWDKPNLIMMDMLFDVLLMVTAAMKLKDSYSLEEKLWPLPTKARLVKTMVFPVVMYGCESWTVKEAECQKMDAFELWCWRRLLRVPWTARRFNQSILKKISPGCSLEGLMLKLKLQYFGHLMRRVDSLEGLWCWEGLRAGGEGDDREWDGWMSSPTHGHEFEWIMGVGDGQGGLVCCNSWGCKKSDTTERLNWTETLVEVMKIMVTSLKRSHACTT